MYCVFARKSLRTDTSTWEQWPRWSLCVVSASRESSQWSETVSGFCFVLSATGMHFSYDLVPRGSCSQGTQGSAWRRPCCPRRERGRGQGCGSHPPAPRTAPARIWTEPSAGLRPRTSVQSGLTGHTPEAAPALALQLLLTFGPH